MPPSHSPDDRRARPLKCLGGPLDGARRHVPPDATEFVEAVPGGRVAVYRVELRRRARGPRFAVLTYVGLRDG